MVPVDRFPSSVALEKDVDMGLNLDAVQLDLTPPMMTMIDERNCLGVDHRLQGRDCDHSWR